ncbi:MAG: hypothetical protein ACREAB_15120, partial [Blastocatellia bacterium]
FQGERKLVVQVPIQHENGESAMEALAIWHKPITPALLSELIEQTNQGNHEKLVSDLAVMLTRWDFVDNGQAIQPTEEVLRNLPMDVLTAISLAITESVYPNSTT